MFAFFIILKSEYGPSIICSPTLPIESIYEISVICRDYTKNRKDDFKRFARCETNVV